KTMLGIAGLETALGAPVPKGGFGVAITAADAAAGTWQFRRVGLDMVFQPVAVGANTILLLRPTDLLRVVPNVTANGAAPLTFKTWDPTLGVGSPGPSNLPPTGPAFGADPGTAVLDLVPVLDLSVGATLNPVAPGGPPSDPATFGSLVSATRVVGTNLGVAVVATKGTGLWEARPAGATAWRPLRARSSPTAL